MTDQKYSSVQRASFAFLTIGCLLCVIGSGPNRWIKAEVKVSDFTGILQAIPETKLIADVVQRLTGDSTLLEFHSGLWHYCLESGGSTDTLIGEHIEGCSRFFDADEDAQKLQNNTAPTMIASLSSLVSGILAIICALVGCCRCCCCNGGRTICHGIMAFISGVLGLATVGLYCSYSKDAFKFPLPHVSYDWAFYLYVVGSCLITATSFALCFAAPDTLLNMLPSMMQKTQVYSHMQNEMDSVANRDVDYLWSASDPAQTSQTDSKA